MFRQFRRQFAVLAVVALVLAAVPVASAGTVQAGGTVTVPAGTVHDGDLAVFGGTVVVHGTVDGSIEGLAGSILVTGTVTGDIEAAAGSITIRGTVEGNVEGASEAIIVAEGARVGGSLETGSGSLTVDGAVDGDVEAGVEQLTVGPSAVIGGTLRYGAATVDIAEGATVAGGVQQVDGFGVSVGFPFVGDIGLFGALDGLFLVFGFLVNFLLGVVLLVAAPRFADRVAATGAGDALRSGLAGLLALVGTPVVLVALAVTIVGIPLSLAGIVVYLLVLWVGFVYGALIAGTWLAGRLDVDSRWAGLALGLAVAAVASLVPLGGIVSLAFLLLGLGAFALSALALRRGDDRTGIAPDLDVVRTT